MNSFPLTQLVDEQFYVSYAATVAKITERLYTRVNMKLDQLEFAHEAWKNEINEYLQSKNLAPRGLWTYALATLVKNLCNVDCVSYSIVENGEIDAAIRSIQSLLIQYPNQYTALEFIRSRYLEIYFLTHNKLAPDASMLKSVDFGVLRSILQKIKHDPRLAENYVSLLYLPAD
jgi:hypothetical protein